MISKAEISFPHNDEVTSRRTTGKSSNKAPQRLSALLRNAQLKQWDGQTADVKLLPVSCVDIYRDLVVRSKEIQLLPERSDSGQAQIAPYPAGVLITGHDAVTLTRRCRKLELETSASNKDIRYSLYIAAGFAVTDADNGNKHRAPVLLIPVELIRSRGRSFAIRYSGGALRLNPHIAESCETHVEQMIEPFKDASELRDYLRATGRKLHSSLHCQVSANTGLFSLQSDVLADITPIERHQAELERTRPGIEFRALPLTPRTFNAQLAIRMLRFIDPDKLDHALLNFIGTPVNDSLPSFCLLYTSPSPRDKRQSRMPSSA